MRSKPVSEPDLVLLLPCCIYEGRQVPRTTLRGGETEGECGENSKRPWIHVAERIPKREDIHTLILPRAARGIQMTRDDGCEISHDRLRCCCLLLAAGGDCNEKAWGATTERYSSSEVLFWMN